MAGFVNGEIEWDGTFMNEETGSMVSMLWNHDAFQKAYEQRDELLLPDCCR